MILPRTAAFDEEVRRYRLVYTCEDCGYFDPGTERCRHEWPTELHRKARQSLPLVAGAELHFCKEFEAL